MSLRAVSVLAVALFALQGCTKHVYSAVLASHDAMADSNGCFRQCQRLHAGQTKQFLSCVETCPDSRVVREKKCDQLTYDAEEYGCTTAHAQAFDGVAFGLGIGFLVLLNVLLIFAAASTSNSSQP